MSKAKYGNLVDKRYIYLIYCPENGYYKIGISKDPEKRIGQLQTGSATSLQIVHTFLCADAEKVESHLHEYYKSKRLMGEWFSLDENDVNEIKNFGLQNLSYLYGTKDQAKTAKNAKTELKKRPSYSRS